MKVVGKTDNGYIFQASADEVMNLIGFYSAYDKTAPQLKIGDEITVAALYRQLYDLKSAVRDVRNLQGKLRIAADLLELPDPIKPIELPVT
jgi:hypothetical protein